MTYMYINFKCVEDAYICGIYIVENILYNKMTRKKNSWSFFFLFHIAKCKHADSEQKTVNDGCRSKVCVEPQS